MINFIEKNEVLYKENHLFFDIHDKNILIEDDLNVNLVDAGGIHAIDEENSIFAFLSLIGGITVPLTRAINNAQDKTSFSCFVDKLSEKTSSFDTMINVKEQMINKVREQEPSFKQDSIEENVIIEEEASNFDHPLMDEKKYNLIFVNEFYSALVARDASLIEKCAISILNSKRNRQEKLNLLETFQNELKVLIEEKQEAVLEKFIAIVFNSRLTSKEKSNLLIPKNREGHPIFFEFWKNKQPEHIKYYIALFKNRPEFKLIKNSFFCQHHSFAFLNLFQNSQRASILEYNNYVNSILTESVLRNEFRPQNGVAMI